MPPRRSLPAPTCSWQGPPSSSRRTTRPPSGRCGVPPSRRRPRDRSTGPEPAQLRHAAVELVPLTPVDAGDRVRLGPECAVGVLLHRPGRPVRWYHRGGTVLREPEPALRQDRILRGVEQLLDAKIAVKVRTPHRGRLFSPEPAR